MDISKNPIIVKITIINTILTLNPTPISHIIKVQIVKIYPINKIPNHIETSPFNIRRNSIEILSKVITDISPERDLKPPMVITTPITTISRIMGKRWKNRAFLLVPKNITRNIEVLLKKEIEIQIMNTIRNFNLIILVLFSM